MMDVQYLCGVELGGTKAIAVLARETMIREQVTLPTRGPDETLAELSECLRAWNAVHGIAALGIASFGPICVDPSAPGYGRMYRTPKPGWAGVDVFNALTRGIACPRMIDTDVNGSALAEYRWGAGAGTSSLCYVTIGTGVGGGLVIGGRPVHGAMHPEIGHLRLRRSPGDGFAGVCPFHADCIEGLVSGPALAVRFDDDPALVADGDPRWLPVASDMAELAGTILLTTSAQRILFGGGVAGSRPALLDAARSILLDRYGSYLPYLDKRAAQEIMTLPTLGHQAGPLGAVALADAALKGRHTDDCQIAI